MRRTSRARRFAAAGLTIAIAGGAAASAASASPPGATPIAPTTLPPLPTGGGDAGGGGAVAATTMSVVDDSRTITIEVPASWTQVVTTAGTAADNSAYPQIVATSDLASFQGSFDTSGVIYAAQPLNPDTAAGLTSTWDFGGQCTDGGTQPYTDAYFTGTMQTWTACAGGQAKVVTLFATPMDQRFSVALLVGIATPAEEDALTLALASFFVTKPQGAGAGTDGSATAPGVPSVTAAVPAVPGGAATTIAPVPGGGTATVVPTSGSGDSVIIEDDTQTIGVGIPAAWTQVNTSPATDAQGQQVPAISAAPDLTAFQSGQGIGVFMVAAPYAGDLQSVLPTMAPQGCQGGAVSPYQDQVFTGLTQTFENCNGLNVTLLAANRQGNATRTIQIIAATTPGDDSPLQIIASTFDFAANAN